MKKILALILCFAMVLGTMSFSVVAESNGAALPNAEVLELGAITIDEYRIYDGNLSEGGEPIDLQVAMEFIAKDSVEEAEANAYGNYTTDFFITIDGINGDSFVADDCYLAGNYGTFGWIMIPLDGMTIEEGVVYPVITSVNFDFKYVDICRDVKDFKCGIYFSEDVLEEHPDLTVSLALGLSETFEDAQNAVFTTVDEYEYATKAFGKVAKIDDEYYATLKDAVDAASNGDEILLLDDAMLTGKLGITKPITINGDGHSIIADETAIWYTVSGKLNLKNYKTHLIGVNSDDVTLKNVVLDNNNNAAGINVYCAQNVVFDNVSIINATKGFAALTVNGSTLTVKTKLEALGNAVAIDISNGSDVTSDLGVTVEDGAVFDLGNKTVKFASVAVNDMSGAKTESGDPYFAAMDSAYYYTAAQLNSRTTAFSNGLTLLSDVELSKTISVKGTFDLNGNTLKIADGEALKVDANLSVEGDGTIDGTLKLTKTTATITGPANLDVTTDIADYRVVYKNGIYSVEEAFAAKIGDDKYFKTVTEAVAAAQEGDTIQLLDNITEDVTIDKALTLDGGDYDYTGTMTLKKVNVTILNLNVVGGNLYKNKNTGAGGNFTIKDCTFDGQGYNGYAINLGGTATITIENCTAKDYGYGFMQVPSSNNAVSVKNAEISDVNYGIKVDYSNGVTLEDVKINANVADILDSNYGVKTYTIKNCEFTGVTPIGIWDRNTGKTDTFIFYGENKLPALEADDNAAFKMAKDAILFAPEALTVTTDEANGAVEYTDGAYRFYDTRVAAVDGVKYATLQEAIDAATDGAVITVLRDIELADSVTVAADKNITLDLNGKTISGTHGTDYSMIHVLNGAKLTVKDTTTEKNGKITCAAGGNNVGAGVWVEGKLVLESGTIEVTGSWTLGFAVDLRPNAWGTPYTEETSFIMNGGSVKSTDTAVRVASNSSDSYPELGVTFTMNGGSIDSTWDAIFVQHLYEGDLNVNVVNGTVSGDNSAMRIYGGAGSDIDMIVTNGEFKGAIKVADAYKDTDAIVITGGTFSVNVSDFVAEGFEASLNADGTYSVVPERSITIVADKAAVVADEEVTISVIMNGENMQNIDFELTYDPAKFELQGADNNGKIVGRFFKTDGSVYENGKAFATYTFKAIAQSEDTTADFIIDKTFAYTEVESLDGTKIATANNEKATVTINAIIVEITPDYVSGKALVLVYTNAEDVFFKYDGKMMVDVTARGYLYNDTKAYDHVFGFVTDGATADADKVSHLFSDTGLYKILAYNADLNFDNEKDLRDITTVYSVYNVSAAAFGNLKYQKNILKSDIIANKHVDGNDTGAVVNRILYPDQYPDNN